MEIYQVGGAVRDRLLGLPVKDVDWVVVGATEKELLELGFRRVGRDFPVFLHPETNEEYALARRERKTGRGYQGFAVDTDPGVTLEQDLERRDLTINAMALDEDGRLVDPYHGRSDLERRLLRHVSPAFVEDPLRVLRVARFAARFHGLGFRIAPETQQLISEIVASGEMDALVPERVWQETERALGETRPDVYFRVLRYCGALAVVFPELDALFGVPQPAQWHPEIDTGLHTMMVLRQAAALTPDTAVRFAALTHDLGKGATPPEQWPSHRGHETRSVELVESLCDRLRIPNRHRELAVITARHHGLAHRAFELRPATVHRLFADTDALRRPERFEQFLLACEADARGRTGLEDRPYEQADYLRDALAAVRAVSVEPLRAQGLEGPALGEGLRNAQIDAIRELRRTR